LTGEKMDKTGTRPVTYEDWKAEKYADSNFMPWVQFENEYCYGKTDGKIYQKPINEMKPIMVDPHVYYGY
jgi:hypothetical protein